VGRSLGENVGRGLRMKHTASEAHFEEIGSIVSAACLAHDLGNPPFGHSGEEAISTFFPKVQGVIFKQKLMRKEDVGQILPPLRGMPMLSACSCISSEEDGKADLS